MINTSNEDALWAYKMGFKHGLDKSIPRAANPEAFYRLGFDVARMSVE